jgi:hypothetical protein
VHSQGVKERRVERARRQEDRRTKGGLTHAESAGGGHGAVRGHGVEVDLGHGHLAVHSEVRAEVWAEMGAEERVL